MRYRRIFSNGNYVGNFSGACVKSTLVFGGSANFEIRTTDKALIMILFMNICSINHYLRKKTLQSRKAQHHECKIVEAPMTATLEALASSIVGNS